MLYLNSYLQKTRNNRIVQRNGSQIIANYSDGSINVFDL